MPVHSCTSASRSIGRRCGRRDQCAGAERQRADQDCGLHETYEALLRGARHEHAVARVEAAARESARARTARAVEAVQQPVVDARRAVKPDGVIDARHHEVAAQERGAVRHRRGVEQPVVGDVRQQAADAACRRRVVCRPRASRSGAPARSPPARAGCTPAPGGTRTAARSCSQRRSFSGSLSISACGGLVSGWSSSGGGTSGAVDLVFEPLLGRLEGRRADEDLLAVLDRHHAPRREAAAVAAAIDAVDDGLGEVAAPQEVRVHRMHDAAVVDRGMRGHQCLAQHLPAEHLRAARVAALAAKQVDLETLELELLLEVGELLSITELERALHHREVAGEGAEERVRLALLEQRGRELHRCRLAAADHLGVRDHARVAFLEVVVRRVPRPCRHWPHAAHVRGLGEHPVVAHGLRRQLARVLERDFDFGAVGGHGDFFLVEVHLVGAGDLHLADLVGGESPARGERQ